MVEDEAVIFTGSGTQATPKNLNPAHFAFCWPGEDNAANITIKTGYQNTNVNDDFGYALFEAADRELPFVVRCAGCHNFNRHASAGKFNRDKIGVSDIYAKQIVGRSSPFSSQFFTMSPTSLASLITRLSWFSL